MDKNGLEELALVCKKKEIEALKESRAQGGESYLEGKAAAYADIWELAAFGEQLGPIDYNIQNGIWSAKINERMEGPL